MIVVLSSWWIGLFVASHLYKALCLGLAEGGAVSQRSTSAAGIYGIYMNLWDLCGFIAIVRNVIHPICLQWLHDLQGKCICPVSMKILCVFP